MALIKARGRVIIEIEKRLPVQGGLGGASANAVAALLALERSLKKQLSAAREIANRGGSRFGSAFIPGRRDGLGVGRGEEVYPLPDLPRDCVVVTPESVRRRRHSRFPTPESVSPTGDLAGHAAKLWPSHPTSAQAKLTPPPPPIE